MIHSSWYIYIFPLSIGSKVNLIAQLEFAHAYYDVAVQYVSHYTTQTPSVIV